MEFQTIDYPWRHVIVDDFLPVDFFQQAKNLGDHLAEQQKWGVYQFDEGYYPDRLRGLPTDPIISSFIGVKHYLKNMELWNIMCQFDEIRPHDYDLLDLCGEIHVHHPGYQYKIHDEHPSKIISMVTYISPEHNRGTMLHPTENGDESIEIEWKTNRCMIFAGKTGTTWHSYQAGGLPRVSLNFFAFENRF